MILNSDIQKIIAGCDEYVTNGRIVDTPYTLQSLEIGQTGMAGFRSDGSTSKKILLPAGGTYGYCFHYYDSYYRDTGDDRIANADSKLNVAGGTEIINFSLNTSYTSGLVIYWRIS